MADTQNRPSLQLALQQMAATKAGSLLSAQIQDFEGAGTMLANSDLASCDASAGAFTLTLPDWDTVYEGKPYWILEWEGTNGVTLEPGAGTIDGAATYSLPAGQAVCLIPYAVDSATQVVTWASMAGTPGSAGAIPGIDSTAIHDNVAAEISAIAAKATPVAADYLLIEDSAAADAKKSITIGDLPIAQAQVSSTAVQVLADGAADIVATTGSIQLASTTAGSKAITTTSSYAGQKVHLLLLAATGGDYTLALDVGTLTLNAASECAVVQRNAANTAWIAVGLSGATIV